MTKHLIVTEDLLEGISDALEEVRAKLQERIDAKLDKGAHHELVDKINDEVIKLTDRLQSLQGSLESKIGDGIGRLTSDQEGLTKLADTLRRNIDHLIEKAELDAKHAIDLIDKLRADVELAHATHIEELTERYDSVRADTEEGFAKRDASLAEAIDKVGIAIDERSKAWQNDHELAKTAAAKGLHELRADLENVRETLRTDFIEALAQEDIEGLRADTQQALADRDETLKQTLTRIQSNIDEQFKALLADLEMADTASGDRDKDLRADIDELRGSIDTLIGEAIERDLDAWREREALHIRDMRLKLEQALFEFVRDAQSELDLYASKIADLESRPLPQDGKDGAPGPEGKKGERGEPGKNGKDGEKGERGERGVDGRSVEYYDIWKSGFIYHRGNLVTKNGSLWIALRSNVDEPPDKMVTKDSDPPWRLSAMRGERGEKGERGVKGDQGPEGQMGPAGPQGRTARIVDIRLDRHQMTLIDEDERELTSDATEFIIAVRDAVLAELDRRGDV